MALIVQKYGGTSVATLERIRNVAARALATQKQGNDVVVIVSAMSGETNRLLGLAREISETPSAREVDALAATGEQVSAALTALTIQALGGKSRSLLGHQVRITTDSAFTKARIKGIEGSKICRTLEQGEIAVVAGFQGVDEAGNITTLGRGGSDTTAVAIAAAIGADACEIYTDVDGVYTTDPRVVPEARKIDRISYDEMLELASLGAGVMHSRSIEFAKKYGVPIHVRSSFTDTPGTWIVAEGDARRLGVTVTGAALAKDEARITVHRVPDRPGIVHSLFHSIAGANIVVDMIVQNRATDGTTEVSFTVDSGELAETLRAVENAARAIGATGVAHEAEVAKVSVVGLGMRTHTGVATTMFEALAAAGINIQMITTSEIKISVLVDRASAALALRTVHKAFELDRWDQAAWPPYSTEHATPKPTQQVQAAENGSTPTIPSAGMEELVISGVELDEEQACLTLFNVPDEPGYAGKVFRRIAEAGVFVDMIVQNVSTAGNTHLSFTVPRTSAEAATRAVTGIGPGDVLVEPTIAKLSVLGVGMRTHTGVATRMFGALAERGINIALINTSEVRINVVTEIGRGQESLNCLKEAFSLSDETNSS